MLIRDRIFDKLEEMNMTQKEFSECTGIPQTTISDWKKEDESDSGKDHDHMQGA